MSRPFRLAGLLRVRGLQERAAAEHLSRAALEHTRTQARERELRAALSSTSDVAVDVRALAALAASRVASRGLLADLALLGDLQQTTVDDARARHAATRVDQRGLARLADAHTERERAHALRAEQAELDEIAVRPPTQETS